MSAFDDFHASGFAEASDIIGTVDFTIGGITGTFSGIVNEYGAAREIDLGGIKGSYTASIVLDLDQLADITGPLERTLDGKRITLDGRAFKIDRVAIDEATATLGLTNVRS